MRLCRPMCGKALPFRRVPTLVVAAAKRLGISRSYLHRLISELNIS